MKRSGSRRACGGGSSNHDGALTGLGDGWRSRSGVSRAMASSDRFGLGRSTAVQVAASRVRRWLRTAEVRAGGTSSANLGCQLRLVARGAFSWLAATGGCGTMRRRDSSAGCCAAVRLGAAAARHRARSVRPGRYRRRCRRVAAPCGRYRSTFRLRPCFSASSRASSRPASERLRKPSSGRAASLAPINMPSRAKAAIGRLDAVDQPLQPFDQRHGAAGRLPAAIENAVAAIGEFEPRAARRSRARRARRQNLATAPAGPRRSPAAGPRAARPAADADRPGRNALPASACALAAPNTRAPTGLAHRIRVPSVDHSHAGRALVACTASRGSPSACNWNSALFIATT